MIEGITRAHGEANHRGYSRINDLLGRTSASTSKVMTTIGFPRAGPKIEPAVPSTSTYLSRMASLLQCMMIIFRSADVMSSVRTMKGIAYPN